MGYVDDIDNWRKYATRIGLKSSLQLGPLDKLLAKLGYECAPSIFWKFHIVALFSGVQFGIIWGTFMYFTIWGERPVQITIVASLIGAVVFGFPMAWIHSRTKKKFGLTTWEHFKKGAINNIRPS